MRRKVRAGLVGCWFVGLLGACHGSRDAQAAPAASAQPSAPAHDPRLAPGWRVTIDEETGAPVPHEPAEPLDEPVQGARANNGLVDEPSAHGGRMVRLNGHFHMHSQVELDGSTVVQRCTREP